MRPCTKKLKILFLNQTNLLNGGASIAANRLADGLKARGHQVSWLTKESERSSSSVIDRVVGRVAKGRLTCVARPFSSFEILNHPLMIEADVVHFHNLHGDFLYCGIMRSINRKKRVFWTLHDMWAFTGHCAYSMGCDRWKIGCGRCPHLNVYPEIKHDWTALEWKIKSFSMKNPNLNIICPSKWLAGQVGESLLKKLPLAPIPYGLDLNLFSPMNKTFAKESLGLNAKSFTFLLASADLEDPRKPQRILCKALNDLRMKTNLHFQVVAFGSGSIRSGLHESIELREFGQVRSDLEKAKIFSAADVFLFTSLADNLPLVIQESLACGTPVIANCVGGVDEMVVNGDTGHLLTDNTSESYYAAMESLATRSIELLTELSMKCRQFALANYGMESYVDSHLDIYRHNHNLRASSHLLTRQVGSNHLSTPSKVDSI